MIEGINERTEAFIVDCVNHGLGLVDEQDGEAFTPFLKIKTLSGGDATHVLMASDIQEAFDSADQVIGEKKKDVQLYGLIWDGYVTMDDEKTDCLFIELGESEEEASIFIQRYVVDEEKKVKAKGNPVLGKKTTNRLDADDRVGPFLRKEWDKLVGAPVVTFLMVAAADGTIDDKEKSEFAKIMVEQKGVESQALKAALGAAAENIDALMSHYSSSAMNFVEQLSEARSIISQYAQDGGVQFCKDLCQIAERVAASSGGFLGLRSIGKKERNVISFIEEILLSNRE